MCIKSSLMPGRLQLGIESSPCVEMICKRPQSHMPIIWVRQEPHHNYRGRINPSVCHLAHTVLGGEPLVSFGPSFTEFPETLSATRLLAPLVNGDRVLLADKACKGLLPITI